MILKKTEKNNLAKAIYSSSNICASTYDTLSGDLIIIFSNGGQYLYEAVAKTDYMRFEMADSQGSVLNTHIKKYKTTKLDKVNTDAILSEVQSLAIKPTVTVEMATKEMLEEMNSIISKFIKNGNLTNASMVLLKTSIAQYETVLSEQPKIVA